MKWEGTPWQSWQIFGHTLRDRVEADAVTEQALHCILGQKGILRVDEVKKALNVDYRTLERRFKATTGLTPKEFARIIRFKNAYKAFRGNQGTDPFFFLDWGYYDQSHYIREFRHFVGSTPGAFRAGLTPVSDAILRQGLAQNGSSEEPATGRLCTDISH